MRDNGSQSPNPGDRLFFMAITRVFSLLIVDDDPLVHQSLKLTLPSHWKVFSAMRLEAIQYERFYHAAFVDMHLEPGAKKPAGPQVIAELMKHNQQLEVVAMSGDLSLSLMESCLKAGAQRFLGKPLTPEEVHLVLAKIEALWDLRNIDSQSDRNKAHWVGSSEASLKIKKRIAELRGESNSILIEGETGTGKEVVSRMLNQQEGNRPFIAVNLASIPEHLFESEMFGHVKGAFTGAEQNKMGLAEAANGGDLFLDEIEALPLSQQAKLLRFLESGEIRKVGSKESTTIQTRVIAASNKPLDKMVRDGEFREDLLYRLSSQKIQLPPLHERLADIAELAQFFLEAERPRRNKAFAEDGVSALQNYKWPGNIRELKRVCEQLSLTSPLPVIRAEDVQKWILPSINPQTSSSNSIDLNKGLTALMAEHEAMIIKTCLEGTKDVEEAARQLQISRSSLYKKIKDYKLEEDSI